MSLNGKIALDTQYIRITTPVHVGYMFLHNKSQKPVILCINTHLRESQLQSALIQPTLRPLSPTADPLTERARFGAMLWEEHLSSAQCSPLSLSL